jgi:hypothetical protein
MATFTKFNIFVQDVGQKIHNLNSDALMILLTNTAPSTSDTVVDTTTGTCTVKSTSNAAEITAANNYSKGGMTPTNSGYTQTNGTGKLVLQDAVWTATGDVGPFQYVVLYNNTAGTTSTRPVIGFYNYGSSITLHNGETFTVDFDQANGVLTIA